MGERRRSRSKLPRTTPAHLRPATTRRLSRWLAALAFPPLRSGTPPRVGEGREAATPTPRIFSLLIHFRHPRESGDLQLTLKLRELSPNSPFFRPDPSHTSLQTPLTPAKAGVHTRLLEISQPLAWIPAFAGMSGRKGAIANPFTFSLLTSCSFTCTTPTL